MSNLIKPRGKGQEPPASTATPDSSVYEHYRQQVKIDRDNLDMAAEQQSQLYQEICDKLTAAISRRDQSKEHLEAREAELASEFRSRTEVKVTEAAVRDHVTLHPTYQAAAAQYEYAVRDAAYWSNLAKSFEMRAKMLDVMTRLYTSGYFTVQTSTRAGSTASTHAGRTALHEARTRK